MSSAAAEATSTPVGALKCQRDSSARKLAASVVSCLPAPDKAGEWLVVLSDTVIFPTGGGQPHDTGSINSLPVIEAQRQGFVCVHRVVVPDQGSSTAESKDVKPLKPPFTEGQEVVVEVDWERRFDHMQQHSGQHLLSAVAERELGFETVAWGLGKDKCHIEIVCKTRYPTAEELAQLEIRVNELIREALPVTVETTELVDRPQKKAEKLQDERPESLPDDIVDGPVRWISIGSLDRNPCCGTHVKNTSQLQALTLLNTEKIRGGKNLRLYFLFGSRVLSYAQSAFDRERTLGPLLSTGPEDFVGAVTRLNQQIRDANRLLRAYTKEIAELMAADVVNRFVVRGVSDQQAEKETEPKVKVLAHLRESGDAEYLTHLSRSFAERLPAESASSVVLVLAAGSVQEGGPIVVVGPKSPSVEMQGVMTTIWKDVMEALGGPGVIKGGGAAKSGKFQGKSTSWKGWKAAMSKIRAVAFS